MRKLINLIFAITLATTAFAQDDAPGSRREAYDHCLKKFKCIFTQSAVQDGKNSKKIKCSLTPTKEAVIIAWEIDNPDNEILDIKSNGVRLYSDRQFDLITPAQAVSIIYDWAQTELASTESAQVWDELNTPEGESFTEEDMYLAAFQYGETSDDDIFGLTYFACTLKNTPDVTAEIDINDETFKFAFDDVGP